MKCAKKVKFINIKKYGWLDLISLNYDTIDYFLAHYNHKYYKDGRESRLVSFFENRSLIKHNRLIKTLNKD